MTFTSPDIAAFLAALGEPAILRHKACSITITGVYDQSYDPGSPIDGVQGSDLYKLICSEADVSEVDTDWTVLIRNRIRPVLAKLPDGTGMITLLLGDPQGRELNL